MSTRSTTWFVSGDETPVAKVYRHTDGYPEGHGVDLQRFFVDVEAQTNDHRFNDPSYLAAKLVVWLADTFAPYSAPYDLGKGGISAEELNARRQAWAKLHPLAFLSVGVVIEDPTDIEYVYVVDCGRLDENGRPTVTCHKASGTGIINLAAVVEIPSPGAVV